MARRKKKVALLATTVPFAFCNERNVKNQRHAGWEAGYNVDVIAALTILSSDSCSECEDTTEYKFMFWMDKDSFQILFVMSVRAGYKIFIHQER